MANNTSVPFSGAQTVIPVAAMAQGQSTTQPDVKPAAQTTLSTKNTAIATTTTPATASATTALTTAAVGSSATSTTQVTIRGPDQLSPGELKALLKNKERTSIIFEESEDATLSYVSLDYPLPLAKAFSSFVTANAARKESIKIGLQQFALLEKAVVKIIVGANNCSGFREDDLDQIKLVFKWIQDHTADKNTEIVEALGVLSLVQRLSTEVDYLTKNDAKRKDVGSLLSFYDRATSPAKWQIGIDAIAFGVVRQRIPVAGNSYQELAQKHQGLQQDVQRVIQQIHQTSRQQTQAPQRCAPHGQTTHARSGHRGSRTQAPRTNGGSSSNGPIQDAHAQGPAQGNQAQVTDPRGSGNRAHNHQGVDSDGGQPRGGQIRATESYASRAAGRRDWTGWLASERVKEREGGDETKAFEGYYCFTEER